MVWGNPGQVAQLVRASAQYAKVLGLIPDQGTYKNQPMDVWIGGTANRCFSLSLPSSLSLSQINQ